MSGSCEIGSRKKQIDPAMTMMTAMADAKIGRSMKNPTIACSPVSWSARNRKASLDEVSSECY
jgi:hypothetical protein